MKKKRKRKFKIKFSKFIPRLILLLLILICIIWGIVSIIKALFFTEETLTATSDTSFSSEEPISSDITIHMSVIGDIMCHTNNYEDAYNPDSKTYDFSHVFKNISPYIENADIAIGNLETTFAGEDYGYSGYPTFNTPSALGENIKQIGIDILSTANNHCMDKGYNGVVNTLDTLDTIGLSHVGTARNPEEQNTILIKDLRGYSYCIFILYLWYKRNYNPFWQGILC